MKLGQWGRRRFFVPAATRVLFFSTTETLTTSSSSSRSLNSLEKRVSLIKDPKVSIIPILDKWVEEGKKVDEFELHGLVKSMQQYERYQHALERVSLIKDPKVSIIPILDKWVEEGKEVDKFKLHELVKRMKQHRRYQHALEVSNWMSDRRYILLTPVDIAVRLDLIYMVHGLEQAEKYFSNIPLILKTSKPYGALLHCYVKEKSLEKAEAHVDQMKKLGLVTTAYSYNLLMNLYSQTGQHEKIDVLMQEMESNGIIHDRFTMSNRLTAYVAISDVGGMENVLDQMEKDPKISVDWNVYAIMADGYLKAGLVGKGLEMMKTVETMTSKRRSNLVLDYLLTLYTRVGKKEDLYRIWNSYKSAGRLQNTSYSTMITSLSKFDDVDGAEKIFEEWESTDPRVDFRVLNRLVTAYGKKGLLEKAESVVERIMEKAAKSGKAPYASTWNVLAIGYLGEERMPKAVEMFKKAMLVARRDWKLKPCSVDSCLEYFEEQGDVEEAEEFVKLLGESGPLTQEVYHRLLRTYIAAQKPVSDVLNRMKVDGFCVDETTTNILETRQDLL